MPSFHQVMNSQVHIAIEPAMSVLTKACAATPLAASAEPPLKPNQPNHSRPVPSATKAMLCGMLRSPGPNLRAADDEDRGEGGDAGADVHDDAAGEVEARPSCGEEAAAPDPVREGDVDEQAPEHQEHQVALEVDPVGEGAGDERRRDDGEHLLVGEVRQRRDRRRPRPGRLADAVQERPVEVADDAAQDVAREGQRVAHARPR